MRSTLKLLLSLGIAVGVSGMAAAHGFTAGDISIGHPYAPATPPSARNGAAYLTLSNNGSSEDTLLSASGEIAEKVEIHLTRIDNGVAAMRPVPDGIAVPVGSKIVLAHDGYHIMLSGLKEPLVEGERVPLTLTFRNAGSVEVELAIEAGAKSADPHAGH